MSYRKVLRGFFYTQRSAIKSNIIKLPRIVLIAGSECAKD